MTYNDYGTPTDTLASPSLSEWAAAVAAELDVHAALNVGGRLNCSQSLVSNTAGANPVTTVVGTPILWGGVTNTGTVLVPPVTGLYRVSAHAALPTNGAGTIRLLYVMTSTAANPAGEYLIGATAPPSAGTTGVGTLLSAGGVWQLAAGTGIQINMRQDSGSTLAATATLSIQLIH